MDSFTESILIDVNDGFEDAIEQYEESRKLPSFSSFRDSSPSQRRGTNYNDSLDDRRIADVVIVTDLDRAAQNVQVQALELIRTKRVFTRTAMHVAPKNFLVIALLSSESDFGIMPHLNDLFCLSHFHSDEDELSQLDEAIASGKPERSQQLSGKSRSALSPSETLGQTATILHAEVVLLKTLANEAKLTAEVSAYLHNIVVFMRLSRYINGGVTAAATMHMRKLVKALAPLHGIAYVPPSLVALAARKVYPHRLVLAIPETEKSLQWGSDVGAVRDLFDGLTIEDVIEDVLASVETPL